MRTFSTDGTRSQMASASRTSPGVGAPKEVPSPAADRIGLDDLRVGVAGDDGAVALHQVEEAWCPRRRSTVGTASREATKYGVPPTDRKARTGEFTPPGMTRCPRSNSDSLVGLIRSGPPRPHGRGR